jgi:CelD/BcsL family acetyltransferase involved in cellulose biosynthesis
MDRLYVDVVEADRALIDEWSRLSSAEGACLYSRPEWFVPWARAFSGGKVHCLRARRQGELVGLVPVIPDGRVLRAAVNGETRRFSPLLADSVDLLQVIDALPARWRRWSLAYLPVTVSVCSGLNSLVERRFLSQELRHSPYVDTVGEFTSWESSRLSSSHRRTMRRRQRRLSELGEVQFHVYDGKQRLSELLDEGFALEASGWKGQAGTAVSSRPAVHGFFRDFLFDAAELGILRMFFLRLNGAAIACHFTIEDQQALSSLKIAFDEQYRSFSPGVLINRATIEYCFQSPDIRRFDFHGEAEKAKLEWTDDTETQIGVEVFSRGLSSSIERAAIQTVWAARNSIRRRVPVEVRDKVDTSGPVAAVRSLARLGSSSWRRGATPSRPG